MPLRSRIAVCFAFGLSALACAVSVYKLAVFESVFDMMATDRTCECQLTERGERAIVWRDGASLLEYHMLIVIHQIRFPTLIYLVLPREPCSSSAHHYPHWVLYSESSSARSQRTRLAIVRPILRAIAARAIPQTTAPVGCTSGATTHSTTRRMARRQGCTPASMTSPSFPRRSQSRYIVKIPSRIECPPINRRGTKWPPQGVGPGIVMTII
jgi:hypothetical protein